MCQNNWVCVWSHVYTRTCPVHPWRATRVGSCCTRHSWTVCGSWSPQTRVLEPWLPPPVRTSVGSRICVHWLWLKKRLFKMWLYHTYRAYVQTQLTMCVCVNTHVKHDTFMWMHVCRTNSGNGHQRIRLKTLCGLTSALTATGRLAGSDGLLSFCWSMYESCMCVCGGGEVCTNKPHTIIIWMGMCLS